MNIIVASLKDESAESLARKMLADATGEKPENIVFYRGENGKPLEPVRCRDAWPDILGFFLILVTIPIMSIGKAKEA